jgi:Fe2+ or Zn2+ uptake regulation protein
VELRNCDLGPWSQAQGEQHGFRGISHTVELDGICSDCSAKQK